MASRTLYVPEQVVPGKRLGRAVHHDPRSFQYPARRAPELRNALHRHYGPVENQGSLGSCTGWAAVNACEHKPLHVVKRRLGRTEAEKIYSRATQLDPFAGSWPPHDTGSTGLDACKAAVEMGLIAKYEWNFGLQQTLASLVIQPVMIGSNWYDSMDKPTNAGYVSLTAYSQIRGGHEYVLDGIDVREKTVRALNSWGDDWGVNGYFYMTWDTLDRLLQEQGDCVVPRR